MRNCLISVSLSLMALLAAPKATAQSVLPALEGESRNYTAMIEMPRAYISGVCILKREGATLKGCIFNEFGISALAFIYTPATGKVKIVEAVKMLDRCYIKRMLKHDLRQLMGRMEQGESEYRNEKRKISYTFKEINNDSEE